METKFAFSQQSNETNHVSKMSCKTPFDSICTPEDMKNLMAPKPSLPKCPSWSSFAIPDFQSRSGTATPDGTPQSSPRSNRKMFGGSHASANAYDSKQQKSSWLMNGLLTSFGAKSNDQQEKSRSYRNISNFDINAVSPISF